MHIKFNASLPPSVSCISPVFFFFLRRFLPCCSLPVIKGIFSFCPQNSISLLHNGINCIRRRFYCVARGEKRNHSSKTMDRRSDCIALLRKIEPRVQGLTAVQMIVSVNVSLGLSVSWLSEQSVCDVLRAGRHSSIDGIRSNVGSSVTTGWSHRSQSKWIIFFSSLS